MDKSENEETFKRSDYHRKYNMNRIQFRIDSDEEFDKLSKLAKFDNTVHSYCKKIIRQHIAENDPTNE